MLYLSVFDAKGNVTLEEINRERAEWFHKGRDRVFQGMCKSISRYEVAGRVPLKIFFVIETDDPNALNLLSHHFGDMWDSVSYPVIKRELYEALKEDKTIVGG